MGDRAATLRRPLARAAACSVALAAAVCVYAACGFSTVATGGPPDGLLDEASVDANVESRNDGGDGGQGECTSESVVCGSVCTDTKSDPQNCGACGKACAGGQTCSDGNCTVLCVSDKERCGESCVDTTTDPLHCGSCTNPCAAGFVCSAGKCATDCGTLSTCKLADAGADGGATAYCANETNDRNNCGACGNVCKDNEVCVASSCKAVCATSSRIGDVFAANMVGCIATIEYNRRANACPAGATVCTAQEWVARRAAKVPSYNYWTNDDLRWAGQDNNCSVSKTQGQLCGSGFRPTPMRVCGKKTDPEGNKCKWTNCGLGTAMPNQYFGGCEGNVTAGSLCCVP